MDVVVDNTAPQTQILSGPSAATASRSAKFTFSAGEPVKEWWCRLDQYAWLPCGSSLTVTKLSDGLHKLEVRAKDFAGNLDVTPARWVWSVTGAEAQPIAGASSVQTAARSAIALDREGRLQLAVALPRTRVTAEQLRRGLRVATGCSRACTIRARLQLLGARRRTLAGTRLRARPGRKATVRLRVKRGLPADARLQLVVSAGTASVRRPLALDRPR